MASLSCPFWTVCDWSRCNSGHVDSLHRTITTLILCDLDSVGDGNQLFMQPNVNLKMLSLFSCNMLNHNS